MGELTPYICVADARRAIEFASAGVAAPDATRDPAVTLHLEVDDVDAVCARVTADGTTLDRGPEDNPPVGRVAVFRDPFGHRWFLNQRLG